MHRKNVDLPNLHDITCSKKQKGVIIERRVQRRGLRWGTTNGTRGTAAAAAPGTAAASASSAASGAAERRGRGAAAALVLRRLRGGAAMYSAAVTIRAAATGAGGAARCGGAPRAATAAPVARTGMAMGGGRCACSRAGGTDRGGCDRSDGTGLSSHVRGRCRHVWCHGACGPAPTTAAPMRCSACSSASSSAGAYRTARRTASPHSAHDIALAVALLPNDDRKCVCVWNFVRCSGQRLHFRFAPISTAETAFDPPTASAARRTV